MNKPILKGSVCLLFLLALPFFSHAETFYPTTTTELQNALYDAAHNEDPDDTIELVAGTYEGAFGYLPPATDHENHSLTIIGAGKESTFLRGSGLFPVLQIHNLDYPTANFNVSISGITFTGGENIVSGGGGLRVQIHTGDITLESCTFLSNMSVSEGGGAFLLVMSGTENEVAVRDCLFHTNRALQGAGLYLSGAGATVVVEDNYFLRNDISDIDGKGSGAFVRSGGPISVLNNRFKHNDSGYENCQGGGLFLDGSSAWDESPLVVEGNTFEKNRLYGGGKGGGIYSYILFRPFRFVGNYLYSNEIGGPETSEGGGAYLQGIGSLTASMTILNNVFLWNMAPLQGTALSLLSETIPTLANNTFSYNNSGIRFTENESGVFINAIGANIYNNIMLANHEDDGWELYVDNEYGDFQLHNNNIGNLKYHVPDSTDISSNFSDFSHLTSSPDLYHLANSAEAGNPNIDTGREYNGMPTVDFDGEPRIVDGDQDGVPVVDVGADELAGQVLIIPSQRTFTTTYDHIDETISGDWELFQIQNQGSEPFDLISINLETVSDYWYFFSEINDLLPLTLEPGETFDGSPDNFGLKSIVSTHADHYSLNRLVFETTAGTYYADLESIYVPPTPEGDDLYDGDLDGSPDMDETGPDGDEDYDGNCDDFPDRLQDNVATVKYSSSEGPYYISYVAPKAQIGTGNTYPDWVWPKFLHMNEAIGPVEGSGPSAGNSYPYGFWEFEVTQSGLSGELLGGRYPVSIILPADGPEISGYVKRTIGTSSLSGYYDLADPADIPDDWEGIIGARIEDVLLCDEQVHQVIHLDLKDGVFGDLDNLENNVLVDPGGPAITPVDNDIDDDGVINTEDNCPSVANPDQVDFDEDGAGDACDGCPIDPLKTEDGVCGCGTPDVDTDSDGVMDCVDNCVNIDNPDQTDSDGDGIGDACETSVDSDSDGVPDDQDNCLDVPNPDQSDADSDGYGDVCDGCPTDALKLDPGICGCGTPDMDSDADGTLDCIDNCPVDPNKIEPGICDCGISDIDTDGDDTMDCLDACIDDPNKTDPGICGCGTPDVDSDADGTMDCIDNCPADPNKIEPGLCGCGVSDIDSDGDGIPDCIDNCIDTYNPNQTDSDGDGIGDACDSGGDVTPPVITLSVTPEVLWPPNHKMVAITVNLEALDDQDPSPTLILKSVIMNEGEETNTFEPDYDQTQGDGHTIDDIVIDAEGNIFLRAERSGKGDGRIYTITYQATDDAGNMATESAIVRVPHSQ